MTFLDTVDGKLARVTLTATRFGHRFDHGKDVVHPPFWYAAWGFGLAPAAMALPPAWLEAGLWAMLAGYVLGRLCEGYFIRRFGFSIFVWRRFDSLSRSEEHTSELQSLMRISYAVFCLKKKNHIIIK